MLSLLLFFILEILLTVSVFNLLSFFLLIILLRTTGTCHNFFCLNILLYFFLRSLDCFSIFWRNWFVRRNFHLFINLLFLFFYFPFSFLFSSCRLRNLKLLKIDIFYRNFAIFLDYFTLRLRFFYFDLLFCNFLEQGNIIFFCFLVLISSCWLFSFLFLRDICVPASWHIATFTVCCLCWVLQLTVLDKRLVMIGYTFECCIYLWFLCILIYHFVIDFGWRDGVDLCWA